MHDVLIRRRNAAIMREAELQNRPLVADLVSWVAERPRDYDDVMTAWRTSCPQLTIWEDAVDAGLLVVSSGSGSGKIVRVTDAGREFLRDCGHSENIPAASSKC